MDNKKGQEEIAGFVAIVVIVTIIGLIFLGLSMNKEQGVKESKDEKRLLESMMEYTSECAIYEPNYRSVQDLIKDCYSEPNKVCTNGKSTCTVLNESVWGMINSAYPIGEQYVRKGFIFNVTLSKNVSNEVDYKEVMSIQKGNCSSGYYVTADYPYRIHEGTLTSKISVCY